MVIPEVVRHVAVQDSDAVLENVAHQGVETASVEAWGMTLLMSHGVG